MWTRNNDSERDIDGKLLAILYTGVWKSQVIFYTEKLQLVGNLAFDSPFLISCSYLISYFYVLEIPSFPY